MESGLIIYNVLQIFILILFYFPRFQVNLYLKCFLSVLFSYLYIMFFGFFKEYLINASYLFFILYCVLFIIELFSNHETIQKKIRDTIFPHIMISSSILFALYVISINKYWVIDSPRVLENDGLLWMSISIILEIGNVLIINKYKKKIYNKSKDWLVTGIFISIDILLMVTKNITFGNKLSTIDWMMLVMSILIFVFFMFYMLIKDDKEMSMEELSSLKHDLKHAVSMIKVNEIEKEINGVFIPISSGNTMIDSILNQKLKELIDNEIEYKCYVNITEEIKINEEDFSLLLINLLDNCIEHCNGPQKYVSIDLYNKNKNLILKTSNSISEKENIEEKKYKEGHGFGLKSIKNTVDKYHGIIKLTEENHNFCCGIVFFDNE